LQHKELLMKKTPNTGPGENTRNDERTGERHVPGLALRIQAARALYPVLRGAAFEPMGKTEFADGRERALANRMVTTALRRHGHLNQIISSSLLKRALPARSGLFEAILRLGLTQLLFMPDQAAHSAVHLSVAAARRDRRAGRFAGLLNAVLRQAQRQRETWTALDNSSLFPVWLQKSWSHQYGAAALERFGAALLAGAPLDLTLADSEPELVEALGATRILFDSVRVSQRDTPVSGLPFYDQGRWWVQDVAAALPARLFDLAPGARVLDLCAAPGGKTAQLLSRGYKVTALDNNPARLARLKQNMQRLNLKPELVETRAEDFHSAEKFDGVLIDAPCSATGTFRRHPELIWNRKEKDIKTRVCLQRRIIRAALNNLKPGGTMVYCTCSLQAEEGELQAEWIMDNFERLKPDPVSASQLDGLSQAVTKQGFVRTHPGLDVRQNGGEEFAGPATLDGFFIARFRQA